MNYDSRILKRVREIPDEIPFTSAETGEDLEDFGTLTFTLSQKMYVAEKSIKWKQSIPVTIQRIVTTALRQLLSKTDV